MKVAKPCVHGDVCRAYMRKFGLVKVGRMVPCGFMGKIEQTSYQTCILSTSCPRGCEFYEPKDEKQSK